MAPADGDDARADVKLLVAAALGVGTATRRLAALLALTVAVVIVAVAMGVIHDSSVQRQVRHDLEMRRLADLRSRADAEHQAFIRGEKRGLFGQCEPPEL